MENARKIVREIFKFYERVMSDLLGVRKYRKVSEPHEAFSIDYRDYCSDYRKRSLNIEIEFYTTLMNMKRYADGKNLSYSDKKINQKYSYVKARKFFEEINIANFSSIKEVLEEKYSTVKPEELSNDILNQVITDIQGQIPIEVFIAMQLYMQYHKFYNESIYTTFVEQIEVGKFSKYRNITADYDMIYLAYIDISLMCRQFFDEVHKHMMKKEYPYSFYKLYSDIYAFVNKNAETYPSLKEFIPSENTFVSEAGGAVFVDLVGNRFSPESTNGAKSVDSKINEYAKRVFAAIKSQYIIILNEDKKKTCKSIKDSYEPNFDTIRRTVIRLFKCFWSLTDVNMCLYFYCEKNQLDALAELNGEIDSYINKNGDIRYGNILKNEGIEFIGRGFSCMVLLLCYFEDNSIALNKEKLKNLFEKIKSDEILMNLLKLYIVNKNDGNRKYADLIENIIFD